jgi:prephenate dehydrogenase
MGAWFARFLKSRGDHVTISDRYPSKARRLASKLHVEYAASNVEAARDSNIIILATPANAVSRVISEILPSLREDALVCDICATKSAAAPGLRALQKRRIKVASIHPMFGPLARGIRGRRIIAIKTGKDMRGYKAMKRLLKGAEVFLTDPSVHDKHTAVTLGLPHFLNMAFAMTVSKRRNLRRIRRFAGRTFDLQMMLAEAIANEPETSADIQALNMEFAAVVRDLQRNIRVLASIVYKQDRSALINRYKQVAKALSSDPEFKNARTAFERVAETQSAILRK